MAEEGRKEDTTRDYKNVGLLRRGSVIPDVRKQTQEDQFKVILRYRAGHQAASPAVRAVVRKEAAAFGWAGIALAP